MKNFMTPLINKANCLILVFAELENRYSKETFWFCCVRSGDVGEFSELEQHRLIYEGLVDLVLHEVGHTLGLSHNFFATQMHSLNNIHDRHITEPVGLYSSVMDYTSANIGPDPKHHGQFYTTTPGPYDIWAIEYGYTPSLENPEDEKRR